MNRGSRRANPNDPRNWTDPTAQGFNSAFNSFSPAGRAAKERRRARREKRRGVAAAPVAAEPAVRGPEGAADPAISTEPVAVRAAALIQQGRLEDATRILERHLAVDSDDQVARSLLGLAAFDGDDYVRAEEVYRAMASRPSPDVRALYSLGVTLERQGRIEEAQQWLSRAAEMDPNFRQAATALARVSSDPQPRATAATRPPVTRAMGHTVAGEADASLERDDGTAGAPGRRPPMLAAVLAAAVVSAPAYYLVARPVLEAMPHGAEWERILRLGVFRGCFFALVVASVAGCVAVAGRRAPAWWVLRGLGIGAVAGLLSGALQRGLRESASVDLRVLAAFVFLGAVLGATGATGVRSKAAAVGGACGGALAALLGTHALAAEPFARQLAAAVLIVAGIWAPVLLRSFIRVGADDRPQPSMPPAGEPLQDYAQPVAAPAGQAPGSPAGMSQWMIPGSADEMERYKIRSREKARIDAMNENWYAIPWPVRALALLIGVAVLAGFVGFAIEML